METWYAKMEEAVKTIFGQPVSVLTLTMGVNANVSYTSPIIFWAMSDVTKQTSKSSKHDEHKQKKKRTNELMLKIS